MIGVRWRSQNVTDRQAVRELAGAIIRNFSDEPAEALREYRA